MEAKRMNISEVNNAIINDSEACQLVPVQLYFLIKLIIDANVSRISIRPSPAATASHLQ